MNTEDYKGEPEDYEEEHEDEEEILNNDKNKFVCERCGHKATTKGNLILHLKKKNICSTTHSTRTREEVIQSLTRATKPKIHQCNFCESMFSTPQGKHQHMKACSKHPKNKMDACIKDLKMLRNEIDTLRDEFHKEISTLKQQILVITNIFANNNDMNIHIEQEHMKKSEKKQKKQKIPQPLRELCWNTYIGESIGKIKCLCCGIKDITPFNFNCGHVIAEAKGGKVVIENLRPICSGCNSSMGSENMDVFKQKYFG